MMPERIPTDCPRCGKVLYPISAMRPKARLSLLGKAGFLFAGIVSATAYLLGFFFLRERVEALIPSRLLMAIVLVPALVPGILIGLVVNRLPGVVRLHCSRCHWDEKLSVPRIARRAKLSAKRPVPTLAEVGSARVMPGAISKGPNAAVDPSDGASAFDQIIDEQGKYAEIRAWIYAELIGGRSFDEISAEMRSGGWPKDHVEILVEEGRKATRDRRP